jgi:hypothetical protein
MFKQSIDIPQEIKEIIENEIRNGEYENIQSFFDSLFEEVIKKKLQKNKFTPIETLIHFNNKVSKLTRYRLWNLIKNTSISVNIGSDEGIFIENYPEEELDAVILTIRLFIQNNDGISIDNLKRNVYENSQIQIPPTLKEHFIETRSKLKSYLNSPSPVYRAKEGEGKGFGEGFLPEEKIYRYKNQLLLDIMIYGNLSHLTKIGKYEEVYGMEIIGDAAKIHFINLLRDLFEYMKEIKDINTLVLESLQT